MKAIIFGSLIVFFAACTKPTFDVAIPNIDFTMEYTWGTGIFIAPAPGIVEADITANGITAPFSAFAANTSFYKSVYATNNGDSTVISISSFDSTMSRGFQFSLANLPGIGTYNIDNTAGLRSAVMTSCTIDNIIYPGNNTVLSGAVTIDTLTTNRIHAVFTITCGNGTQTVDIRNGVLAGDF